MPVFLTQDGSYLLRTLPHVINIQNKVCSAMEMPASPLWYSRGIRGVFAGIRGIFAGIRGVFAAASRGS